jgi:hypothetical protein
MKPDLAACLKIKEALLKVARMYRRSPFPLIAIEAAKEEMRLTAEITEIRKRKKVSRKKLREMQPA